MLNSETPYPYQGSFALYIDTDLPESEQRAELVRILYRSIAVVVVSFPLRTGASGNKRVPAADLIDPTPLDQAERKEMVDIDRHLSGRNRLTPKMKAQKARYEALRQRTIWSTHAKPLIARANRMADVRRAA